jgi:CHASE3 domain sensor protein
VTPEARHAAVGLWVAVAILGCVGVVAYETTTAVADTTAWVEHTHEVIDRLLGEREALTSAEALSRAHGPTSSAAWLDSYTHAIAEVTANREAVRALTVDSASQQKRMDELEPLVQKRAAMDDVAIEGAKQNADRSAPENAEIDARRSVDIQIYSLLSDMVNQEQSLLALRQQRTAATVTYLRLFQVTGTIASLIILVFAFRRLRREIARRFLSEQAANEGEESLAKILMSIGDGVIATDLEGRVVRMNRVTEELTGWTAATGVGKHASEIFHVIDAESRARFPIPSNVLCAKGSRRGSRRRGCSSERTEVRFK